MDTKKLELLLADDDEDDCLFFKQALSELPLATSLTTVYDGEQLMQLLTKQPISLPGVLFLDLNMPRKNGFECLIEIKQNETLHSLPVIILSTNFEQEMVNRLYRNGAHYCIRKPAEFARLKQLIKHALTLVTKTNGLPPTIDDFILKG